MYESTTAKHYAAYRPPLHKTILEKIFTLPANRQRGLDIGCGTGLSCQALTRYCDHVIGIDPSLDMLGEAATQPGISYLNADGQRIPLTDNSIDVATMAGSLNYLHRKSLIAELTRVCRPGAEIAIYDFEIDLSHFQSRFAVDTSIDSGSYNHRLNLSGFSEVEEIFVVSAELMFHPEAGEITHLLLADDRWYRSLQKEFYPRNVFESLKRDIESMDTVFQVKSRIYYSMYRPTE
jgi:ubiquinone/menaquinone biosynthesis C-methylase UbiE